MGAIYMCLHYFSACFSSTAELLNVVLPNAIKYNNIKKTFSFFNSLQTRNMLYICHFNLEVQSGMNMNL